MTIRMTLSGFLRRLPNILSFVTPIFVDEHGRTHAQADHDDNGIVDSFVPLDTRDDGFIETEFPICVSIFDAALYGFEISENTIIVGSARALSEQLRQMLSEAPHYRAAMPRTSEMIDRFVEFATGSKIESAHSCLYHIGQIYPNEPRHLVRITDMHKHPQRDNALGSREGALEWLALMLGSNHQKQLTGHAETTLRVHDMIRTSEDAMRAAENLAEALQHISIASSMTSGLRMFGSNQLCNDCFIELKTLFSTHGFLGNRLRPPTTRDYPTVGDLISIMLGPRTFTSALAHTTQIGNFSDAALARQIEEDVLKMQSTNKSFRRIVDRATRVDGR